MQRIARPRRNGAGCHSKKNNGNIAETFWRTDSDGVLRTYGYVYDALNRMTDAHYAKHDSSLLDIDSYKEHVAYDRNGNIQALERNGEFDDDTYYLQTDDLTYTYDTDNPNQLLKVDDASGNPNGFKDGVNTGDDYEYDANGNMTSDLNKDITGIRYNHMNLPIKISFGTTDYIEYLYDAAGTKLRKTVSWIPEVIPAVLTPEVKVTDYLDGYQYEDDALQFFPTAEGYVKNTPDEGNHFNYVYNYTDHLGNIRLSYGYDETEDVLKILEENNYYPFGLKHANYNMSKLDYDKVVPSGGIGIVPRGSLVYQYKYNGKELQDELGLDWYDYGARNYDAGIGRWMNVDPLAENSRRFSPYTYALNNPNYFIDPDGMDIVAFFQKDKDGNHIGKSEYESIVNSGLGSQFQAKFSENDNGSFSISLEAVEGGGDLSKLSKEQRSFYDSFNAVATDHSSLVVQDVVMNDENVQVDSYAYNKTDIGDMQKANSIGDKNHTGGTSQGLLIHNLVEQYEFTKMPGSMNMSPIEKFYTYDSTHPVGISAENAVNGNKRLEDQEYSEGNLYHKFYQENNGTTTKETITHRDSNMTITKSTTKK